MKKIISLLCMYLICSVTFLFGNEKNKEEIVAEVLKERTQKIDLLLNLFNENNNKETNFAVFYTLGELRAEKAISLCLAHINYDYTGNLKIYPKYGPAPAATALSKIGLPSVKPLLDTLKNCDDEAKLPYIYMAIIGIGGTELAEYFLVKEIKITPDKKQVERLNKALEAVALQKHRDSEDKNIP